MRQQVSRKCSCHSTNMHGVTSQKTVILIFAVVITSHLVWLQVRSLINAQLVGAVSATTTCWRYTCDYIQVKRTSNARSVVPTLQSVVPLCLICELTQVWSRLFAPSVVASLRRVQPWRDIFVSTPRCVLSTDASIVFRFVTPCSVVDMDWCSLGKYLCSLDTRKPEYMVSSPRKQQL